MFFKPDSQISGKLSKKTHQWLNRVLVSLFDKLHQQGHYLLFVVQNLGEALGEIVNSTYKLTTWAVALQLYLSARPARKSVRRIAPSHHADQDEKVVLDNARPHHVLHSDLQRSGARQERSAGPRITSHCPALPADLSMAPVYREVPNSDTCSPPRAAARVPASAQPGV